MSLARTVGKNFAVQTLGRVLSSLVGLGLIIILTRTLGPATFGEFTTAINFLQFFGVIVDFGLTLTLVVMMSKQGADESRVAGNVLGLRMFSAAIIFTLAPVLVLAFPYTPMAKAAVAIGAIGYFFMAGAAMLVGVYQKHGAMWRATLAEVTGRVVLLVLTLIFAWQGFGILSMFWAMVIGNAIWLILTVRFAQKLIPLRPRAELVVWKDALSQSWPIALSIAFNLIYLRGDVLILAWFRESAEVGFYGVAYRLLDVLTTIPVMFMGLILPALTARWNTHDGEGFARLTNKTFDLFVLIALPIIFGTLATSTHIISLIAGPGFEPAAPLLNLLILAVPGIFLGGLYGHSIVALGLQRRMIWAYAITAFISVIGYVIFIPRYGAMGAGAVTVFSETLVAALTTITVMRHSGSRMDLRVTIKALVASLIMYGTILYFHDLPFGASLLLAVAVYAVCVYLLRVMRKDELLQILRREQ